MAPAFSVYVEVKDPSGKRLAGYRVHQPLRARTEKATWETDYLWTCYEDDGQGNGDSLGEWFDASSLTLALKLLVERIEADANRTAEDFGAAAERALGVQ